MIDAESDAEETGGSRAPGFFCVCGHEEHTEDQLNSHIALGGGGTQIHARTPDRLPRLGFAFLVVDVSSSQQNSRRWNLRKLALAACQIFGEC